MILRLRHAVNLGYLGVQPSAARRQRLRAALEHGFDEISGFGGSYSSELLTFLRGYTRPNTDRPGCLRRDHDAAAQIRDRQARHPEWNLTVEAAAPIAWCFIGSSMDQGLAVHLMAVESSGGTAFMRTVDLWRWQHFTGFHPKPFDIDRHHQALVQHYAQDAIYSAWVDRFWRVWESDLGPLVARVASASVGAPPDTMCNAEMLPLLHMWRSLVPNREAREIAADALFASNFNATDVEDLTWLGAYYSRSREKEHPAGTRHRAHV